jgi:hypothetical protein
MRETLPKAKALNPIKTEDSTAYQLGTGKKAVIYKSSDVITLKVDGKVQRWLKDDFTDEQMDTIKILKAKATYTKIALVAKDLKKRLVNASRNGNIKREDTDTAKLIDFCEGQLRDGIDALLDNTKESEGIPTF